MKLADLDSAGRDLAVADFLADRAEGWTWTAKGGPARGRPVSPATLGLDLAAIGAAAKAAGEPDPRGERTRHAFRGLRRRAAREAAAGEPRGRGQVDALRREAAAAALAASGGTARGLRDAAILRLGSDCLLRVSELAAVRVGDVERREDGSGRLTVRRSKAGRGGRGTVLYVGAESMRAVQAWREAGGVDDGPLFRCTARTVRRAIVKRAEAAGVEGRVSGHSLRVGTAQSLVRAGASTAELMQAGRWRSAATATGYAEAELAGRGPVARLFYGKGY